MKITVAIDVTVERADGAVSRTIETVVSNSGGNPRFESSEVATAIELAVARIKQPAAE